MKVTCVDNDVFRQVSNVDEGFVADLTFMRSDVVMVPDVISQLTRLDKPEQQEE